MHKRHILKVGIIILVTLILGFIDLPSEKQKKLFPPTPQAIQDSKYHLGLDLQGGSQLDYKIDLRKVPEKDRKSIIEGVSNVINTRVNGLGVSEPNIYLSSVGDEQHLIVELAGIKDLEEAKKVVGKTIQLEFKEQRGTEDTEAPKRAKNAAQALLDKVKAGGNFDVLGKEESLGNPGKVTFQEVDFQYKDQVPSALVNDLFSAKPGEILKNIIETSGEYSIDATGQLAPSKGHNVVKLLEKRDQKREIDEKREVTVSHILVAYKGAERADSAVTRTEDEAKKRAAEVLEKLQKGGKFDELAKQYSDDKSNKDRGGALEQAVKGESQYAKEFETAAMALKKVGDLSTVTKTSFGFHIIKADKIKEALKETRTEPQVKYTKIFYSAASDPWQDTELSGKHFTHADIQYDQLFNPYVSIQFNDEGAKLFEKLTEKNVGKPLAIFVGGQLISAPNVNEKISGGKAQISGRFTLEEANKLARDLNTGAIPAPIVLAGQYTIGATLGQDALNKSLFAGSIGFLLVALFMILYYRLPGLLAVIALTIYAILMLFLIKTAMPLYWSLPISVAAFVFLVMKILRSRESGAEKAIGLVLSCFVLFFLSFLLSTPVVMTLAGIAGVVLSIGMAVDANILIFERIKEELRDGRTLSAAIEVGFDRAWNSIRDSNFSSLITCGILFYFGSSIIQGFAFNLAAGILVSMFTAITITKTFISALINTKLANNLWLFGTPKKKEKKLLPIIPNRKTAYIVSLTVLALALISIPVFGLKLGLDFTGGTLMEFKFQKAVNVSDIEKAFQESVQILNQQKDKKTESKIDPGTPHIVPSKQGFIVKTRHISSEIHDLLIPELKKKLGAFEETRFNTVGPTVGESLRWRATLAVAVASIMIVLYVAFAFRKIPRYVSKWRFGTAAIIALLHDLGIMLGVYVYFGVFFNVEIDALFITAMLTILGFSVHDTIVVFDRIREKLKYQKHDESFAEITNQAVNETIARSINTSFSVFLTLLALAIFGGESIRFFVLSLLVGIVAGTYSSVFVASPVLVDWQEHAKKAVHEKKK